MTKLQEAANTFNEQGKDKIYYIAYDIDCNTGIYVDKLDINNRHLIPGVVYFTSVVAAWQAIELIDKNVLIEQMRKAVL